MTMWLTLAERSCLRCRAPLPCVRRTRSAKIWILPVAIAFTVSFWLLWLTL